MSARSRQDIHDIDPTEHSESAGPATRGAHFWDRIARRYAAKPVEDEEAYARKLAITQQYLHADARILELGCGTGSTAMVHAPLVKHITAIDISPNMIGIAREKASSAGIDNIDFIVDAAARQPVVDAEYDAVLALSLLHLLADWRDAIQAAHRMLKPGGVYVTSTMCLQDAYRWMRLLTPVGVRVGLLPPLSFFTRAELEQAVVSAGFAIEHNWQPSPKEGLFLLAKKPV